MEELAPGIFAETDFIGVNVGAISTHKGIVAVDAPSFPRDARSWALTLHRTNHFAVLTTVLTDFHGDRTLNTRWLNAPITTHKLTAERLFSYDKRFPGYLLESLSQRHPNRGRELSNSPVEKPAVSFDGKFTLFKGGRQIELTAVPGPTPSNIWVFVPEANILFVGDTLMVDTHPIITEGNSAQWLESLDKLEALAPKLMAIVPGRGPICDGSAIAPIRDYLVQMRQTIQEHIDAGKTQEETAVYVPEFLSAFPANDLTLDWLKRQIRTSLAHVYLELKLGDSVEQQPYF
jgi:glyoxylase-like metal-dependent hydrolase (beta-lactamase superfamily II)